MSAQRFRTIFRMLRPDNKNVRGTEKGFAVKEMWQSWNERQALLFNPGQGLTVDEQLEAFRGRVFCRQYMPNKPAKYGLKFFNACCSDTAFVLKSKFYLGKSATGERATNQGQQVTEELVLGAEYDGRCVTVDNFFASYTLGESLLKNNITMVGTLRKNRKCIPPALLSIKDRPVLSSLFAFNGNTTLVSYIPKKRKKCDPNEHETS